MLGYKQSVMEKQKGKLDSPPWPGQSSPGRREEQIGDSCLLPGGTPGGRPPPRQVGLLSDASVATPQCLGRVRGWG